MNLTAGDSELEVLNVRLNDSQFLQSYKEKCDAYQTGVLPRFFGRMLVVCGNLVYGSDPSYLKFRAVEVIARVPYQSWSSAVYTLLTFFYTNEKKALDLSQRARYAAHAQENETMHVVVISHLSKREGRMGIIRYTIIPMLFAFIYFWISYFLYLLRPRWSYELNYHFESHAFEQYDRFIRTHQDELKTKDGMCAFLSWYGRTPKNQYDLFLSIRNDEIIHRNESIQAIEAMQS